MSAKSTAFARAMLALIYNGASITGIADNTTTSPNTQYFITLHTGDPGADGDQTTNEVSYTGYARVPVSRNSLGWQLDATGAFITTLANIQFAQCNDTGADITCTHASVGMAVSGASMILHSGPLSNPINIQQGTTPIIPTGAAISES